MSVYKKGFRVLRCPQTLDKHPVSYPESFNARIYITKPVMFFGGMILALQDDFKELYMSSLLSVLGGRVVRSSNRRGMGLRLSPNYGTLFGYELHCGS